MKNGDLAMYNKIILKGITISDLGECHENFKENYLQITMKCNRLFPERHEWAALA